MLAVTTTARAHRTQKVRRHRASPRPRGGADHRNEQRRWPFRTSGGVWVLWVSRCCQASPSG